jgi:hypothetical protein
VCRFFAIRTADGIPLPIRGASKLASFNGEVSASGQRASAPRQRDSNRRSLLIPGKVLISKDPRSALHAQMDHSLRARDSYRNITIL